MRGQRAGASAGDVLQYLRSQPKTVGELCTASGFARSTICDRLRELEGAGLIALTTPAPSSGGRPAGRYAVRSGADILVLTGRASGNTLRVALRTAAGKPIAEVGPRPINACDELVTTVTAAWADLVRKAAPAGASLAAGTLLIDDQPRRPESLRLPPLARPREHPTSGRVAGLPLAVIRTSDALAIQAAAGAGHAGRNVIYVDQNVPQHASWVVDGVVQRGSGGLAGTLPLPPDPPGGHASPAGHVPGTRDTREDGRRVGAALAACVAILNPSLIFIGGPEDPKTAEYLAGVQESVYALSPPTAGRVLTVRAVNNSPDSAMEAAHHLAREAALKAENVNQLVRSSAPTAQMRTGRYKAGAVA